MKQRPSNEAPAVNVDQPQQQVANRMRRSSLEDQARSERQNLAAAITPAIEAMLQVIACTSYSPFSSITVCVVHANETSSGSSPQACKVAVHLGWYESVSKCSICAFCHLNLGVSLQRLTETHACNCLPETVNWAAQITGNLFLTCLVGSQQAVAV